MSSSNKPNNKRRHSQVDGSEGERRPKIRQMGPPFDSLDADCILRTSNGVDFRVHTFILSLASPFFRTMFTLPTPAQNNQEPNHGLPIIPVPESAYTLNLLLRLCYPLAPPSLVRFDELIPLYESTEKYDIEVMLPHIQKAMVETASQDVIGAYAFGHRHGLADLVITAARLTLEKPLSDLGYSPQLDLITGTELQRLHLFHRRCKEETARLALDDWSWIGSISNIPLASAEERCACQSPTTVYGRDELRGMVEKFNPETAKVEWEFANPTWWYDYMEQAESALKDRPLGSTVTDPAFYASMIGDASKCEEDDCKGGVQLMLDFIQRFGKKVDDVVSEVRVLHINEDEELAAVHLTSCILS